ncbi:MAG: SufE family protein [Micropepsaceae bacterium]
MTMPKTIEDILSDFDVVDDWEERYRYIIDLGRKMPAMPDSMKTQANKVQGCASQVWIKATASEDRKTITFEGDSDAMIVRGLIALLMVIYSGQTASFIIATDVRKILARLGLDSNLSQQRSNGLNSMIECIRADANTLLQN